MRENNDLWCFLIKAFTDKRDPVNIPHFGELRLWDQESTPQKPKLLQQISIKCRQWQLSSRSIEYFLNR
jgi:hypothetical protein